MLRGAHVKAHRTTPTQHTAPISEHHRSVCCSPKRRRQGQLLHLPSGQLKINCRLRPWDFSGHLHLAQAVQPAGGQPDRSRSRACSVCMGLQLPSTAGVSPSQPCAETPLVNKHSRYLQAFKAPCPVFIRPLNAAFPSPSQLKNTALIHTAWHVFLTYGNNHPRLRGSTPAPQPDILILASYYLNILQHVAVKMSHESHSTSSQFKVSVPVGSRSSSQPLTLTVQICKR